MIEKANLIIRNQKEFLNHLRSKFHLYHNSNVFYRDLHYGVMEYLQRENIKHGYTETEAITSYLINDFIEKGIFRQIDSRTWMVNYPEFKKISTKAQPPSKPAAPVSTPPPSADAKPVDIQTPAVSVGGEQPQEIPS